jgi:hypothetical protein
MATIRAVEANQRVTIVPLDRSGRPLFEKAVTLSKPPQREDRC